MIRMWSNRHFHTLMVGVLFATVALEIGVATPSETTDAHTGPTAQQCHLCVCAFIILCRRTHVEELLLRL